MRCQRLAPTPDDLMSEVIVGLKRSPKSLPCKLFYDEQGSALFERICELPEYYLMRTEIQIMELHVTDMAKHLLPETALIEFGSGNSRKTDLLLTVAADKIITYIPIDISEAMLVRSATRLDHAYPDLKIYPVCADYMQPVMLPDFGKRVKHRVVYFPGSTIGNFPPEPAHDFLLSVRQMCGAGGGLLIGVDLHKDKQLLEAAYNDAAGVTAEFNLNILQRLNREFGADFDLQSFEHESIYNDFHYRIEMFLVSTKLQKVTLQNTKIHLEVGERIHTEYSYKYRLEDFGTLLAKAGFQHRATWLDPQSWFSVQYFQVT